MSKYAREVSSRIRGKFSLNAGSVRKHFIRGKSDEDEASIRAKQERKQYLVKGRMASGVLLWDVFELDGFSDPKLAGTDFSFQEEAIAFARDRSLGRVSVGYGKLKGVFRAGKAGVLVPGGGIDLPNQKGGHVPLIKTKAGIIVG